LVLYYNRGDGIDSPRSGILTAGGSIAIFSGMVGIGGGFYYIAYRDILTSFVESNLGVVLSSSVFTAMGIVAIISGLCAILGGSYALWRKRFILAVILGGVCSLITSFLALSIIGLIFGIMPIVFILMSQKEFA